MRARTRLAVISLLGLSLAACADRDRHLLEPNARLDAPTPVNPPLTPLPRPPRPGFDQFFSITAGGDFSCARRNDSQVYCWGGDDVGQVGRSPSRTRCLSNAGVQSECVYEPSLLYANGSPLLLRQVDAGYRHACGLDATGVAYCWGDGNLGEVGAANGFMGIYTAPMPVTGGRTFAAISAGTRSTCATSYTNDAILCWGKIHGQTGGPTVLVQDPRFRWNAVSVGEVHVCGIDINGVYGAVRCYGQNGLGQSGQPNTSTQVTFDMGTTFPSMVLRVSTQSYTTCVDQNQNGTVQCVGSNGSGQLGNGQTGFWSSTGNAQTVGTNLLLRQVSVGDAHACAIADDNSAYCWGSNINGQLGNNSLVNSSTPVPVSGGHTYRAIAVGERHTCAIGTDNLIYCWGRNDKGQLGNFFVSNPKIPTPTAALVQ